MEPFVVGGGDAGGVDDGNVDATGDFDQSPGFEDSLEATEVQQRLEARGCCLEVPMTWAESLSIVGRHTECSLRAFLLPSGPWGFQLVERIQSQQPFQGACLPLCLLGELSAKKRLWAHLVWICVCCLCFL